MAIAGGIRGEPVALGAVPDHRYALYRRRRNRARSGNPADRLDVSGRPLRRVHAADGRLHWNPLVRIKAISMRKDAVYYNLHMPWENTGSRRRRAMRDPAALRTAGVQVKDINVTLGGCAFWHGRDLDQETAGRRQECAPRRALGDGFEARRRGRRRHRRQRSGRGRMGRSRPACRATAT